MENEKIKTLKEMGFRFVNTSLYCPPDLRSLRLYTEDELKAEAMKDLDINNLTEVLGTLTDLDVIAIKKYIIWKNNLTEVKQ